MIRIGTAVTAVIAARMDCGVATLLAPEAAAELAPAPPGVRLPAFIALASSFCSSYCSVESSCFPEFYRNV